LAERASKLNCGEAATSIISERSEFPIGTINRRLKASGVAEIDPEAKPEQEDDADDSDLE
jgi:hypothetical protein